MEGQVALGGFTCQTCRAQCAEHDREIPCDTGTCPYTPSPGFDGALDPENWLAVYLWERLQSLGPAVWELVHLELTPAEAALLLEQLHELTTYSAYLRRLQQEGT